MKGAQSELCDSSAVAWEISGIPRIWSDPSSCPCNLSSATGAESSALPFLRLSPRSQKVQQVSALSTLLCKLPAITYLSVCQPTLQQNPCTSEQGPAWLGNWSGTEAVTGRAGEGAVVWPSAALECSKNRPCVGSRCVGQEILCHKWSTRHALMWGKGSIHVPPPCFVRRQGHCPRP